MIFAVKSIYIEKVSTNQQPKIKKSEMLQRKQTRNSLQNMFVHNLNMSIPTGTREKRTQINVRMPRVAARYIMND